MSAGPPAEVTPAHGPGVRCALGRALRLRCPRCGVSALFAGPFRMHEACAACGLRYEREAGYFVGAIYVNYVVTAAIAMGGVILLDVAVGLTLQTQLILGVGLGVLVPILFFRYSRSLWLCLDYLVTSADTRAERRRRPPRP